MKAAPADQAKLLDIAGLDQTLSQLAHKAKSLPEHEAIAKAGVRLTELNNLIVAITTEQSDIKKELLRADADVDQVRSRVAKDQSRLDAGQGSPKELEAFQHELVSLARRQSELEDIELEIMERMESAQLHEKELRTEHDGLSAEVSALESKRDGSLAAISGEEIVTREMRGILASQIDDALLAQYSKLSESIGAPGAAALHQRRCQGCRLEINAVDIEKFRAAAADEVLRCEECRRILVRTSDSGL